MRKYVGVRYYLVKVNEYGEEIDSILRFFDSVQDAWNYLKNVEHIKSRRNWEVREV